MFVTKYRRRMQPSAVEHLVNELSADAGIEMTPHTLRHTFAKSLVDSGAGIERVAAILGHSSLNTTRLYTSPSEQDLAVVVERLAE